MNTRYAAIWFPHLLTDWLANRKPELKNKPFVLTAADHGKTIVTAVNILAQQKGVIAGMSLADAKAFIPSIEAFDDKPELPGKLLRKIAEWCIRFTPVSAVDLPDGIILDISGCTHLWGGEELYLQDIKTRFNNFGYSARIGIADTIGTAWAISRFGRDAAIVKAGTQTTTLLSLPPSALRLEGPVVDRLHKLGLNTIGTFIGMQRSALRRRFGVGVLQRIDQASGKEEEFIEAIQPLAPYHEFLPCLEPIVSRKGIEIALEQLLNRLCARLQKEGNGLRTATLKCYRADGNVQQLNIGTHNATNNRQHLFRLFELQVVIVSIR